jgi:hypothetical protein
MHTEYTSSGVGGMERDWSGTGREREECDGDIGDIRSLNRCRFLPSLVRDHPNLATFDNSGSEHHAWLMAMPYFARQDKLTGGAMVI